MQLKGCLTSRISSALGPAARLSPTTTGGSGTIRRDAGRPYL
jgi:hypothetical protein